MSGEADGAENTVGPDAGKGLGPIGLLPSLVTLGNLICGFAAIWFTTLGLLAVVVTAAQDVQHPKIIRMAALLRGTDPFAIAAALIFGAMVFDALDGKIARMANLTSEFGAQLDSLCDIVSFGVAPAYLVFVEALSSGIFRRSRYAWVCAVLYVICAALRLARFNVETEPDEDSHMYFSGLPTPAAAGVIAGLAIVGANFPLTAPWAARIMPFAAVILAGLMISQIRYVHLLNALFRGKKPFTYLVLLVFVMFVVLVAGEYTEVVVLFAFAAYMGSGPVAGFARTLARWFGRRPAAA